MIVFTDYLWFNTKHRQEFVRITDDIAEIVAKSGVKEGTVLVSAMHITAGVYVNDWENGLIHDFQEWLEKLAPSGDAAHYQRQTRSRALGAGVLCRVRRTPQKTCRGEGHGDLRI